MSGPSGGARECTLCGQRKPLRAFAISDPVRGYRRRQCGPCRSSRLRFLREHPDAARMWRGAEGTVVNERGRECTVCGVFKAWPDFNRAAASTGHGYGHDSHCRACRNRKRRMLAGA